MRETVPSSRLATQTEPKPETISAGRAPTAMSSMTRFVFGSMTATELARPRAAAGAALSEREDGDRDRGGGDADQGGAGVHPSAFALQLDVERAQRL